MKKRDIILFVGIVVASIIGTKTLAGPIDKNEKEKVNPAEVRTVIEKIKNNPEFSMFYEAIEEANLSSKISNLDEMTLMIPTNKAFKLLPKDVWENFMDEENRDGLKKLLNYHVIPDKVNYDDLREADNLNTLEEQSVKILHGDELKVENAVIKEKYEETQDIVVYRIDRLIMPI